MCRHDRSIAEQGFDVVELACNSFWVVRDGIEHRTNSTRRNDGPEPEHVLFMRVEVSDDSTAMIEDASFTQSHCIVLVPSDPFSAACPSHSTYLSLLQ